MTSQIFWCCVFVW